MNSTVSGIISCSPAAAAVAVRSTPGAAVSRRFNTKAAAANCVTGRFRSELVSGAKYNGRVLQFQFSGLRRMSTTEGLAKRSRDPQLEGSEATVKDEAPAGKRSGASGLAQKSRGYVAATMSKPGVKSLVVAVAIPLILGSIDGLVNAPNTPWYFQLKKPWWQPPSFLFGATWSILYPLMGLASWLVWAEGGFHVQGRPLTLYITQLVLNLLWPVLFFGQQKLGLALVDIFALCGAVFATIKAFQPVNHVAANLMKPYFAWVVFATLLNANLWYLNRGSGTAVEQHPHAE
ncbi:hypothetical protein R1flu_006640 [Riccia fluitans]|uniref:Translocator protein n=1 Tax=Riccia fluitans TaxID=41844 RepID=A0ABD1YWL0_9MARC